LFGCCLAVVRLLFGCASKQYLKQKSGSEASAPDRLRKVGGDADGRACLMAKVLLDPAKSEQRAPSALDGGDGLDVARGDGGIVLLHGWRTVWMVFTNGAGLYPG
jgi:hypothetical protein